MASITISDAIGVFRDIVGAAGKVVSLRRFGAVRLKVTVSADTQQLCRMQLTCLRGDGIKSDRPQTAFATVTIYQGN